jgi:S-formylglutathione hydrolase
MTQSQSHSAQSESTQSQSTQSQSAQSRSASQAESPATGAASTLERVSSSRSFGGEQLVCSHRSEQTGTTMRFGIYLPPQASAGRVPVLYWLSGLTCTEENFITKAGAQRMAAQLGLVVVAPDTSPRGLGYPGEDDGYDFGTGAGFYVDATVEPWVRGYRMYSYISGELPALVAANFPVDPARTGIFGHSMGGHGALTIALKNPGLFRSVSAFAPIASATRCPWGEKALSGYLGPDRTAWEQYDASALVESRGWRGPPLLIDQGTADGFLADQLKPELLEAACSRAGVALDLRRQEGYDHSYFFMATFMEDHLRYHASNLG